MLSRAAGKTEEGLRFFVWKTDQQARSLKRDVSFSKDRRTQQNLKLALAALFILGMLLLVGKAFQIYSEFQKPFYALNTKQREYSWDGKSVINLLVGQFQKDNEGNNLKGLNFVSLNPAEGTMTIIKLSDEIQLEVPKNFGEWKLASVYKLGEQNNPPMGEDLLKMSVSKLMALPVDGVVEMTADSPSALEDQLKSWKANMFSGFQFLTSIRTDLSLKESMDFVTKSSKIRPDKITSLDLFKSTITQSKLLPDSSRVLGVDGVKLDSFIKDNLADSAISNEDLTVAVYNGTDHPGLTSEAVRLVDNLGARVTIISNTNEKFVKNGIYVSPDESAEAKNSQTYKRLAEIFAVSCIKEECKTTDSEVTSSRAAITIVLGEEYFNYWSSR